MTEDAYIEAIDTLLRQFGMRWGRPVGFDAKGRYFSHAPRKIFGIYVEEPHHLTPTQREQAVSDLRKTLKV